MDRDVALPDTADTVIVGGGVMGSSTAFFLASRSSRNVVLLERDHIASGSTGDSSANLRHHYTGNGARIYSEMAWWSHEFYRRFETETGYPLAHEDNPRVRFGIDGMPEGDVVEQGYQLLQTLGIPATKHLGDGLEEEYPMFANLDEVDFAISDDAAGYSDGTDAANGFARAASDLGATIAVDTPVTNILVEADRVHGVETTDSTIRCDEVVLAAGPWSVRLGEQIGLDLPITPTREQIIVLEPDSSYKDQYLDQTPTTRLHGGDWYIRPDFGEGLLVATHYGTESCDPDDYKETPDEEKILEAVERLSETIPSLEDAGIRGQYCGVYSMTPDADFIIDQAGPDGCYVVSGFSGHGFKHAPAVGRIVSDLVTQGETDLVNHDFFSLTRFEDDPMGHGSPEDQV